MELTETTCCYVMLTVANDFTLSHDINIHGPPMSSLYTLDGNDPVQQPDPITKFPVHDSRIQFVPKEVWGRV